MAQTPAKSMDASVLPDQKPAWKTTINQSAQDQADDGQSPAVFPQHLIVHRLWVSGQANVIFQAHPAFHSPYSGANSYQSQIAQTADSRVFTLYTGALLTRWTEIYVNVEKVNGKALSSGLGLAGSTNVDVTTYGRRSSLARYLLHETVPLTRERVEQAPSPYYLQSSIPKRRLELLIGRMSLTDFLDVNCVGSDSHLQFTNAVRVNNGAWDFAADLSGYTLAGLLQYESPTIAICFAEALMPTVANGEHLDDSLRRARSENLELEWRHNWHGQQLHVRPLVYLNHANMGDYKEAIRAAASTGSRPDVTATRRQGRLKQGFGVNLEQSLPAHTRVFIRAGWNEGHHESFVSSEINNTVAVGADVTGDRWHRPFDRAGSAFETSGISLDHRRYLGAGGLGFLLGDDRLNYSREYLNETYYTAHVMSGLYLALQMSFVQNPGYNADRGPIVVPGIRAHVDF